MVGPPSKEERLTASRRLKAGFVLLVGFSTGFLTLIGNPTILVFSLAVLAGCVVGVVLVFLAFPRGFEFR